MINTKRVTLFCYTNSSHRITAPQNTLVLRGSGRDVIAPVPAGQLRERQVRAEDRQGDTGGRGKVRLLRQQ